MPVTAIVVSPKGEEGIPVQNSVINFIEFDKRVKGAIKCCHCPEILTCEAVSQFISIDVSTGHLTIVFKEGCEGLHCNSPEVSRVSER